MLSLWEALRSEEGWSGSLDELVSRSNALAQSFPIKDVEHLPARTRSTAINFRSEKILSPPHGKSFLWLHLVQFCGARFLVQEGWKRGEIASWIQSRSASDILGSVERASRPGKTVSNDGEEVRPTGEALERAYRTVRLLAAGIVQQYQLALRGEPLIHDRRLNPNLTRAMMGLASLYLLEGRDNVCGSVHEMLIKCKVPFHDAEWGLEAFRSSQFPYAAVCLLDPDARLPTLDCNELAKQTGSELDLREQLAFEDLRATSDQFAVRANQVYSILRGYVASHPITTFDELRAFEKEHDLQPAHSFLMGCYDPIQPHHLVAGELYICAGCKIPMGRANRTTYIACRTPQCTQFDRPVQGKPIPRHEGMRIAKSHILTYWIAPGIDELAIFRKAQSLGLEPILYPDRDSCDIGLDKGGTGIDVKSYASPFLLAEALTRELQGLAYYDVRIVAINDQCVARVPSYLDILRREYRGKSTIEFMKVSTVLAQMEER